MDRVTWGAVRRMMTMSVVSADLFDQRHTCVGEYKDVDYCNYVASTVLAQSHCSSLVRTLRTDHISGVCVCI